MNRSFGVLAGLAALLAPSFVFASSAVTNAGVVVERFPLELQKVQDLNFGIIAPSGSASGTVVMSSSGALSATGGATVLNAGSATPAAYVVSGVPGTNYSVQLPSTASLSGPSGSMVVSAFTGSSGSGDVIGSGGTSSFTVGATLAVPAGQLPGAYSGTFTVTVAYN